MKLLYITNGINGSGGLERVLSVKASYLADHFDYDITILSLNDNHLNPFYTFSRNINMVSIRVGKNPFLYIWNYIIGIRNLIRNFNPDVISVCDDGFKGLLFPILFGTGIPVIYERHVSKQIEYQGDKIFLVQELMLKFKFHIMNLSAKRFHKFVVLTEGNLKEWNLNNLKVIPNPLPFSSQRTSQLKNKKILAVGKQSYQKGYDRLLESWEKVVKIHPDWHLEIYGKLDPNLGLESIVSQLQLKNNVDFFPPIKEIQEKYYESSIYVMSSRFEGFGMVLIEAMEFGLPCISFNCPHGPASIIQHQLDGLLIKNGDIEAFADAIIRLIENTEERVQMGLEAKKNVQRFKLPQIARQWDDLFRNMVDLEL